MLKSSVSKDITFKNDDEGNNYEKGSHPRIGQTSDDDEMMKCTKKQLDIREMVSTKHDDDKDDEDHTTIRRQTGPNCYITNNIALKLKQEQSKEKRSSTPPKRLRRQGLTPRREKEEKERRTEKGGRHKGKLEDSSSRISDRVKFWENWGLSNSNRGPLFPSSSKCNYISHTKNPYQPSQDPQGNCPGSVEPRNR